MEPDPITSLLQSAANRGERSFAPYAGLEAAEVVRFGMRAADGYDSFALDTYARLGHAASGCDYAGFSVSVPPMVSNPDAARACPTFMPSVELLALLNIRYVLLPSSVEFPSGELVLSHESRSLYELEPGLGRAFGVAESVVAPEGECIDTLTYVDLASHAVLEEAPPQDATGKPPTVISSAEAPNRATYVVDATDPGLLVRSESWAPGWIVAVDGDPAPLLRVDCALQGVWLEAGTHAVIFTYAPSGYIAGRWISLAMCTLLLAGLARLTYQRQRNRKEKRHA